ncbi:MAG: protein-glutamate O-methyltransferase CheR [Alphaproteobacteria bacterium]|nr:protein-glutamate O-methyltransferase CheR [Alphaproteobacteria bacterium]
MAVRTVDAETMEIDMLLEGIRGRYGYDFTHYSRASLKRRIRHARQNIGVESYTALLDRLFHDERSFDSFLRTMSISVTEMFRDPLFYRAIREEIIPVLKTYPFVKIWHAGCATGEEVYSMAIMLHEEGFLDRARIYATDFNQHSLATGQTGVYSAKNIDLWAENYYTAGGTGTFNDYYSDSYGLVKFRDYLRKNVMFSYHNLVSDGVFGEMNLICCRNVMIYFDKTLQSRVLTLLSNSLRHGGFLCLGNKETLNFSAVQSMFDAVSKKQRVYRKVSDINVDTAL